MSVAVLACSLVALAGPPDTSAAAAAAASYRLSRPDDDRGTFSLLIENDVLFALDRHYSSGVNGLWTTSRAGTPNFMHAIGRWFATDGEVRATFGGGHNIYTPRSIILQNLGDRDRPFAAFLYATAGIQTVTPEHFDDLTLTLGIIGPAALGRQVQRVIHVAIGPTPRRWDTQLPNEGAAILSYQHVWRYHLGTFGGLFTEVFPHIGVALGNVYDYTAAGFTIRFGDNMPLDYGPRRVLPGIQGNGVFTQTNDFGWYYFLGGEARSVIRNIFIDGSTFRESRGVERNPIVVDAQFGWALVWKNTRVAMTHVLRTKEFERQIKPDFFGSLDLSFRL